MHRKHILGALVVIAAATIASPATSASADAGRTYAGCPVGYVCLYKTSTPVSPPAMKVGGNWSGSISGIKSVFNNGTLNSWPNALIEYKWWNGSIWDDGYKCVKAATPTVPSRGQFASAVPMTVKWISWLSDSASVCR
ncbi:hypothetical protein ACIBG7_12810 [Nonomuraea sp. NPDC050328]|uniref:hypothetical protein n=1 Tax=Nonomuraea sp. NPDC050328 TaxID=3364361 RepID=UPI0037997C8A